VRTTQAERVQTGAAGGVEISSYFPIHQTATPQITPQESRKNKDANGRTVSQHSRGGLTGVPAKKNADGRQRTKPTGTVKNIFPFVFFSVPLLGKYTTTE